MLKTQYISYRISNDKPCLSKLAFPKVLNCFLVYRFTNWIQLPTARAPEKWT